jgi:regulator of nucleoside diphosphate kinase
MNGQNCCVTDADRCRLGAILTSSEGRAWGRRNGLGALEERLEDARSVESEKTPRNLVTMNSVVELMDVESGNRRQVALTYPKDCDLVPNSVSVLEPLGTQLLGSQLGDIVSFGDCQDRVAQIIFQPEAAGARHL